MSTLTGDPVPNASDPRAVTIRRRHRFAQIPEALLFDSTVSAAAVRVYGVLIRHGDDPDSCYPSYRRIGACIGASPRSVPTWIRELEAGGWVRRVERFDVNGEQMSHGYEIYDTPVDDDDREQTAQGRASERALGRADQRAPGAPADAPKESHRNESHRNEKTPRGRAGQLALVGDPSPAAQHPAGKGQPRGIDEAFAEFWGIYPRRAGKGDARKAFARAIAHAGFTPVIAGARRFAADPNLPEPNFIPHPATWLNQHRWEDDALAPRSFAGADLGTKADEALRRVEERRGRSPALDAFYGPPASEIVRPNSITATSRPAHEPKEQTR